MKHVRIHITGIVQGVGMRPFVYREAVAHGISGWVLNAGDGVHIEACAAEDALEVFVRSLRDHAPAASRIDHIAVEELDGNCEPDGNEGLDAHDDTVVQASTTSGGASTSRKHSEAHESCGMPAFRIIASRDATAHTTLVSPDIATCDDCLRELFDPSDRRYHYPFINCTNCGPRFTIIRGLPYDRAQTSMGAFPMCPACASEYADPLDRRFHAQPDACFACGPHITWQERGGRETLVGATRETSDAIIARCAELIASGGIVAIKGLGGFHLACRADSERAVRELRARKRRSNKPLAIMARDLDVTRALCHVGPKERDLLCGSVRPIVLLQRREGMGGDNPPSSSALAHSVAFDLPELGIMLPYTPLQHLLMAERRVHGVDALVMTSGNLSEEPIEMDDGAAWARLVESGIADALLGNDRAILSRFDDSVVRVVNGQVQFVRRARGYAPRPLALPNSGGHGAAWREQDTGLAREAEGTDAKAAILPVSPHEASPTTLPAGTPGASSTNLATGPAASAPTGPSVYEPHDDRSLCVLACGPEQKATLALTREDGTGGAQCFISQHIGDLENAETFDAWQSARARMEGLFDLRPSALACDAHPGYLSSQWAREQARATGLPLVQVQHHHAHIAAVIAEAAAHGEIEANARVIGIAFDGTGAGAVYHSDSPNSGIMRPGSDSDTEAACHNGVQTGSACRDIYTAASETSANGAKARAPKLNIADVTPAAGAANRPLELDGTVWGGEVLLASLSSFDRVAHLELWPLPGGAASVRDPRRNAFALLKHYDLLDHPGAAPLLDTLQPDEKELASRMIERGINCPLTSSMGRLLDAVSAILGICHSATYEGEPAILLEAAARRFARHCGAVGSSVIVAKSLNAQKSLVVPKSPSAPNGTTAQNSPGDPNGPTASKSPTAPNGPVAPSGPGVLDSLTAPNGPDDPNGPAAQDNPAAPKSPDTPGLPAAATGNEHLGKSLPPTATSISMKPLLLHTLDGIVQGANPEQLAWDAHHAIVEITARTAVEISNSTGVRTAALSGGVFMNRLLLEGISAELEHAGLTVLTPRDLPCNDGGIAYGQAAVARAQLNGQG